MNRIYCILLFILIYAYTKIFQIQFHCDFYLIQLNGLKRKIYLRADIYLKCNHSKQTLARSSLFYKTKSYSNSNFHSKRFQASAQCSTILSLSWVLRLLDTNALLITILKEMSSRKKSFMTQTSILISSQLIEKFTGLIMTEMLFAAGISRKINTYNSFINSTMTPLTVIRFSSSLILNSYALENGEDTIAIS